jgi:hypothetical protein
MRQRVVRASLYRGRGLRGKTTLSVVASAALVFGALASVARAETININFGVAQLGGTASYVGANLQSSTSSTSEAQFSGQTPTRSAL